MCRGGYDGSCIVKWPEKPHIWCSECQRSAGVRVLTKLPGRVILEVRTK